MRTLVVLLFVIGLAVHTIPAFMPFFIALAIAVLVTGLYVMHRRMKALAIVRQLEYRIVAMQQFMASKDSPRLPTDIHGDLLCYVYQSLQWLRRAESCMHTRNYTVAIKNATSGLDGCRAGYRVMQYLETEKLLASTVVIPIAQERLPIIANFLFAAVFGICLFFPSLRIILLAMALVLAYTLGRMLTTHNRRVGQEEIHRLQRAINKTMEHVLATQQLNSVAGSDLLAAIMLLTKARQAYLLRNFAYLTYRTWQAKGRLNDHVTVI